MEILLIIVILIIFLLIIMGRRNANKHVYDIAYDLGINYLDLIEYNKNYCVMFDIDDTLIDSETSNPIKPIVNLLKECNKRKLKVLIITARDDRYTLETIEELDKNGIYHNIPNKKHYDFLYLRHSPKDDNEYFKSKLKEQLYNDGYITIMSIGDNLIDIIGEYSGYGIKLPNKKDPRLFHVNGKGQLENVSTN